MRRIISLRNLCGHFDVAWKKIPLEQSLLFKFTVENDLRICESEAA
jgi:hypothetical protein